MFQALKGRTLPWRKVGLKTQTANRPPRSLRSQIVLWNVIVLLLVLALVGVMVYWLFVMRLMTDTDNRLESRANQIEGQATTWLNSGQPLDTTFFNQLITEGSANDFASQPLYLRFIDKDTGQILAHSAALGDMRLTNTSAISGTPRSDRSVLTTRQDETGRQLRVLTFPLTDNNDQTVALVEVNQSLQSIEQVKMILLTVLALGSVIAGIVCYGVGVWFTSRKLAPLSELATTMQALSVQGLQTRLPTDNRTIEVNLLTEAFNVMAARLEDSFTLQRSFVADVSHELRTPLTAMRGELDVMLLNPELAPEARQELQQLGGELNRLSRLVANLLTSARAEVGVVPQVKDHAQQVALDLLLVEVTRQGRYLNPQVSLEIKDLQQLTVEGDRDLLKQLLLNLVDNALTYTKTGGRVILTLTARTIDEQGWAVIKVKDTGPGIASQDLPHIFERHYRANRANIRGKLSSGLGLYIANLIATAHAGRIEVQSELGKGTQFRVWLPLTATPGLSQSDAEHVRL